MKKDKEAEQRAAGAAGELDQDDTDIEFALSDEDKKWITGQILAGEWLIFLTLAMVVVVGWLIVQNWLESNKQAAGCSELLEINSNSRGDRLLEYQACPDGPKEHFVVPANQSIEWHMILPSQDDEPAVQEIDPAVAGAGPQFWNGLLPIQPGERK